VGDAGLASRIDGPLQPEPLGSGDWGDRARLTTTKSLGNTTERASRLELRNEKARLLIRRDALTVPAGTPLRLVIARMQEGRGDCVLVIRDRRLVGIVTERDILMKVLGRDTNLDRPVDELMTPNPGTLPAEATVREALFAMDEGGYRNLPLVDERGGLVGLLRQQDIVDYIAESFPQEILNLPPRPHQQMAEADGA
jgi:CBS domain-containing protein